MLNEFFFFHFFFQRMPILLCISRLENVPNITLNFIFLLECATNYYKFYNISHINRYVTFKHKIKKLKIIYYSLFISVIIIVTSIIFIIMLISSFYCKITCYVVA